MRHKNEAITQDRKRSSNGEHMWPHLTKQMSAGVVEGGVGNVAAVSQLQTRAGSSSDGNGSNELQITH